MSGSYDFKENAKALLKRIGYSSSASVHPNLALVAVETMLREAYARGKEEASKGGVSRAANSSSAASREAPQPQYLQEYAEECHHDWREVFLDGRSVGTKCAKCDLLESEARKKCDHYFVKTDAGEICVACRSPKVPRR